MALRASSPQASPRPGPAASVVVAPGLVVPVPAALEAALRDAVLEHVTTEHRRVFAPVLHLGTPGARRVELPLYLPRPDHALRTDLVEALYRRHRESALHDPPAPPAQPVQPCPPGTDAPPVLLWCTRPGGLEPEDDDLAWSSAAPCAAHELEVSLPLVVVTRQGWRDPATGAGRSWRRLRPARR